MWGLIKKINLKLKIMNNIKNKQKGFTLIELLVVIAIIGILSSIVLVSLGSARTKARDARRQSDVRQISLAMELCYDDASCGNSATVSDYPDTATPPTSIGSYLTVVPVDPTNTGTLIYTWITNATAYGGASAEAAHQWYCVYARSEALTTATYYLASKNGAKSTTTVPTGTNVPAGSGCLGL